MRWHEGVEVVGRLLCDARERLDAGRRSALGSSWTPRRLAITGGVLALALAVLPALLPRQLTAAEQLEAYITENAQTLTVPNHAAVGAVARDGYSVTTMESFIDGATNHDWAKLVLFIGEFPITKNNVTVFTRWMRQENGPPDWFNRNNPLNNGWGSGGGGGLGTYDNLVIAAENAAEALHGNPGYSGIVAAFMASAPTEVTERAIWASPWASGNYNDGAHWSYLPVPVIPAPAGSW